MTEYKVYTYDIVFVYNNIERVYERMTQWNRHLLSPIYNRAGAQFRMQ